MDILLTNIISVSTREIVNNDGQIPNVPANPRTITKDQFEKLKARIAKNNLLGVFPLKVYYYSGKYIALGGNQRLRAAKALKMKDVPCIIVPAEAEADVLREIIILENTHDGTNDWDMLANEWEAEELAEWGVNAAEWGREDEEPSISSNDKEPSTRKKGILICCNKGDTMFIGGKILECGDEIELNEFLQLIERN
jgi:hypothetical protein